MAYLVPKVNTRRSLIRFSRVKPTARRRLGGWLGRKRLCCVWDCRKSPHPGWTPSSNALGGVSLIMIEGWNSAVSFEKKGERKDNYRRHTTWITSRRRLNNKDGGKKIPHGLDIVMFSSKRFKAPQPIQTRFTRVPRPQSPMVLPGIYTLLKCEPKLQLHPVFSWPYRHTANPPFQKSTQFSGHECIMKCCSSWCNTRALVNALDCAVADTVA